MSPAIGIALFVIGVGALLLSIVMDRRPPSGKAAPEVATDLAPEAPEPEPEPISPETAALSTTVAETGVVEQGPDEPEPVPSDRGAAAEARLEKLRAEFVAAPTQPDPSVTPGPSPATEPAARPDAGRVFAAVASVGRGPQEDLPEPSSAGAPEPATSTQGSIPEQVLLADREPAAASESGHGHAIPIVSHSDLVSHLRREHPDLESGGSTIQMRRLHDGAHAS
jgi:hypothetical protein